MDTNTNTNTLASELEARRAGLALMLDEACPDWSVAAIQTKVNLFYFANTMVDGALVIRRGGEAPVLWARDGYERALLESPLPDIRPMRSFREAASETGPCGVLAAETDSVPWTSVERLRTSFEPERIESCDTLIRELRSVKSPHEISVIEECGKRHAAFFDTVVPALLEEGMTETEFYARALAELVRMGHQGVCRFYRFGTEMPVGQFGFGVNSLYPTAFDGPGGNRGASPAAPFGGDPSKRLEKGDCVFVDIGFGLSGYHTDRTQVYCFGAPAPQEALDAHEECLAVQTRAAGMLVAGAVPSEIYREILSGMSPASLVNFMGFARPPVKFLGHGVGLHIDELPVIANGFDKPLKAGQIIALEPKKGVAGFGMTGVEDTYLVTGGPAKNLTGGAKGITLVMP